MKTLFLWASVIGACFVSALYLNWICYGPAAHQDGSLAAIIRLAVKWYGIPAVVVIQLLIWWAMPRLFEVVLSPWLAALVWPFLSAVSKIIVLWPQKRPAKGDWIAIAGMFAAIAASAMWSDR